MSREQMREQPQDDQRHETHIWLCLLSLLDGDELKMSSEDD